MPVEFKAKPPKPAIHASIEDEPEDHPLDPRINLDARIKAKCVEFVGLDAIHLKERNARQHSETQVGRLAEAIEEFGFNVPIARRWGV